MQGQMPCEERRRNDASPVIAYLCDSLTSKTNSKQLTIGQNSHNGHVGVGTHKQSPPGFAWKPWRALVFSI